MIPILPISLANAGFEKLNVRLACVFAVVEQAAPGVTL